MDFAEQIAALTAQAGEIKEQLEGKSLDTEGVEKLQTQLGEVIDKVTTLEEARRGEVVTLERKAMMEQLETINGRLDSAGKAMPEFNFSPQHSSEETVYGSRGGNSYFKDVKLAKEGDPDSRARLLEGKAMGEGVDSSGGFMVIPEISDELIGLRDQTAVLRPLFSSIDVGVDTLRFIAQDSGLAVAWTAEFAEKIKTDLKFSEFEAHVYTAAGLAVTSNQLLADSKWSVDQMITNDLAKRFISLEEQAFLSGTGVGQPLGLINTPGVNSIPYGAAGAGQQALLDKIAEGITEVYTKFLGPPNAIVMHPRTWGYITRGREATAPSTYLIGAGSTAFGRRGNDPIPGYGAAGLPRGELFGLPVFTTANVPTTLGAGTESAIFIGDFTQGLVLDRQGITTDVSTHVFFTSNQTVFRSEERVGFTAGRYPAAFSVIQGAGLAGK